MTARVSLDWSFRGLDVCILENELVRATVIPGAGAKVHELICKQADQDVLFHHPRVEVRPAPFGANVDDYWSGGIDECLPTGAPCQVGGESLPFLGELWSMPWSVDQESSTCIRLERSGVITPFHAVRRMEVRPGEPMIRCAHTITNTGHAPIQFLWGLHAGVPISASTWIGLPATEVVVEASHPDDRLGAHGSRHEWGDSRLLELGSEPAGTWDLHYAVGLRQGWLAVQSATGGAGFGMTFPCEVFRSVWIWMVDGGWRGTRCMAIEPWTGHPAALDEAIASGTASTLAAGESLSAEVNLIVFGDGERPDGFVPDGMPIRTEA